MNGYHERKTPAVVAIVGSLVLVTGVGFTWILRAVVGNSVDMVTGIAISQVRMWAIASILVTLVVYWERRPLASIGFQRPTVKTVGLGVGGFVATLVIFALF